MNTQDDFERLYGIAEVARILGIDRSTAYDRINSGRLKAVELDGMKKVSRTAIQQYLSRATPLAVRSS